MVGSSGALAASLNDFHARATSRASSNLRSVEAAAAALAAVDAVEQQQPQQPAQPEVNQADVATLMDMGFPRERCIEALTANSRYIIIFELKIVNGNLALVTQDSSFALKNFAILIFINISLIIHQFAEMTLGFQIWVFQICVGKQ